MVNKSLGIKVLILPLVIAIIIFLFVIYIKPAFSEVMKYREDIKKKEENLEEIKKQVNNLEKLVSDFENMEEKKLVFNALPEKKDVDNYLAELYQRTNISGVILENFIIKEESDLKSDRPYLCSSLQEPTVSRATFVSTTVSSAENSDSVNHAAAMPCANNYNSEISIKGTWEQVLSFFKYFSSTNRIANVNSIDLESDHLESDLLKLRMSLEIYYKPKSEMVDSVTISTLSNRAEFNKKAFQNLKNLVYSQYEAPFVYEGEERNIFK